METVSTKNCVLNKEAINRKMKRMALEVAEQNIEEKELVIAGIAGNGEVVAKCLIAELNKISSFKIETTTIQLNKKDPLEVSFQPSITIENKVIIIVDDVANTGKTMLYAFKPLLNAHPKKFRLWCWLKEAINFFRCKQIMPDFL